MLAGSPIRGGLQAHDAVAPLAQQHTGADAHVAAADESRHTVVADLPLLLHAVAEAVPNDGGCATVGRVVRVVRPEGADGKREQSLLAASLWMLSPEPDVDPTRIPEATRAPIRRHRGRDRD